MTTNSLPATSPPDREPPILFNEAYLPIEDERLYHVPRALSLASLLGGTLLFSIIFTIVRLSDGGVGTCLGIVMFVAAIGGSQMIMTGHPRLGSMIAGAISLPIVAVLFSSKQMSVLNLLFTVYGYAVLGPFLGYVSGGLLAGFWLIADRIEQFRLRRSRSMQA